MDRKKQFVKLSLYISNHQKTDFKDKTTKLLWKQNKENIRFT